MVLLGLKRWFEDIGISQNVIELDWWQSEKIGLLSFTAVPDQHWSKRGLFDTNKTLWAVSPVVMNKISFPSLILIPFPILNEVSSLWILSIGFFPKRMNRGFG